MEHIAALLLIVGCSASECRELPAPVPVFETLEECEMELQPALAAWAARHPRVLARCVEVDPAMEEEDAELVWEIAPDGTLEASIVASGVDEGAELVADGRGFALQGYEQGFFIGPSLFDNVKKGMKTYNEEIFGPVLQIVRADSFEEAVRLPSDHEYGNGVAIFTRDGDTARDFVNKVQVGMVGVNFAIPVPLAYHTFGGWKRSGFGDLNQHGSDSIRFYTKTKTVTSRWPTGTKEGAEFVIPTMK